jgi:hypothetical protein
MAEKKKNALQVKKPTTGDYLSTLADMLVVNPRNSPAATLGGAAYDYVTKSTPQKVKGDIVRAGDDAYKWLVKKDKALRAAPVTEALRLLKSGYIDPLADPLRVFQQAATERSRGNETGGKKLAAMVPIAVAGVVNPELRGAGKLATKTGVEVAKKTAVKGAVKAPTLKAPDITVTPKPKASKPKASTPPATGKKPLAVKTEAPPAPKRKSVANTFEGVTDYDVAMDLAREGQHLKQGKGGQYAGAPRDVSGTGENLTVDSPEALELMRANLDQKAQEGLFNASWYDRSRGTGADLSGFDLTDYSPENLATPEAKMASLFARGTAAYSPQYTPLSEVNAFAKQHNAKVVLGEDAIPKTRSQATNVDRAYTLDNLSGRYSFDPTAITLGKKTGPYADAKDPTIDPKNLYKTANDLWHGRVVGYSQPDNKDFNRAFTPQEHGFLIGENLLAADRANAAGLTPSGYAPGEYSWTPRSVQAATWGAQRIENAADNQAKALAVFDADKAAYDNDFAVWESNGKPKGQKPKAPKAPSTMTPEEMEQYAQYGIDDAVNENLASMTSEYMPGFGVKQAPELFQDNDLASEFSDVMAEATGSYDPTLRALQTYSLPTQEIPGGYMNSAGVFEENKGYNSPLLGSTYNPLRQDVEPGPYKGDLGTKKVGPQMDEATQKALTLASMMNATRHAQEGTGANMFIPERSTHRNTQLNAAQIEGARPSLEQAIASMRGVQGLDVVDMGDVARVTQFPGSDTPLTPVEIQRAIQSALVPDDVKVRRGRVDSASYWPNYGPEGSGQMTESLLSDIDALNIPNVYDRLNTPDFVDTVRRENAAREAFFAKYGLTSRPDLKKFTDLLAQEGPKSIRDFVAKHGSKGLPAILGGMMLPYLSEDEEQY